jgi:hypothetical protein
MGQFAKRLLRSCTQPLLVLCRPFLRRVDSYLNSHIAQLSGQLEIWHAQHMESLRDFDMLGDSLVREMARLQLQISLLEENLHEAIKDTVRFEPASPEASAAAKRPPAQAA